MFKEHSSQVVKSKEVIGVDVLSSDKEKLGEIEEIVLDKVNGQTQYVVLSFGGILGMGDKYFALPWKAISYSPEEKSFILSVGKEKLKNAPGFDKDNWPDMSNLEWSKSISDYYGSF